MEASFGAGPQIGPAFMFFVDFAGGIRYNIVSDIMR